jgi:hypothetical protein
MVTVLFIFAIVLFSLAYLVNSYIDSEGKKYKDLETGGDDSSVKGRSVFLATNYDFIMFQKAARFLGLDFDSRPLTNKKDELVFIEVIVYVDKEGFNSLVKRLESLNIKFKIR